MLNKFEEMLTGGHPNSLGKTIEVVEEVLADHSKFDDLFTCYKSQDEVVRLRVSNAMKRVYKEKPDLLEPYIDKLINDIAKINQASTKWTLSQLFLWLKPKMSSNQIESATEIMKNNLVTSGDWIVENQTMQTLFEWSKDDPKIKAWLKPVLESFSESPRKSVATRSKKLLEKL